MGDVLLSHTLTHAVPSGLRGLTSVFGMGTGGSPSLRSPKVMSGVASLAIDCVEGRRLGKGRETGLGGDERLRMTGTAGASGLFGEADVLSI
jgi:hypothetical protein